MATSKDELLNQATVSELTAKKSHKKVVTIEEDVDEGLEKNVEHVGEEKKEHENHSEAGEKIGEKHETHLEEHGTLSEEHGTHLEVGETQMKEHGSHSEVGKRKKEHGQHLEVGEKEKDEHGTLSEAVKGKISKINMQGSSVKLENQEIASNTIPATKSNLSIKKSEFKPELKKESRISGQSINGNEQEEHGEIVKDEDENLSPEEKKERARERHKARVNARFPQFPQRSSKSDVFKTLSGAEEHQEEDYFDGGIIPNDIDDDNDELRKYRSRQKHVLDDNTLDNIVEEFNNDLCEESEPNLIDDSTEETSDQESFGGSETGLDTVQMKTDFLKNFELPDLSDISEEEELTSNIRRLSQSVRMSVDGTVDVGVFVDPLTGEVLQVTESEESSDSVVKFEEEIVFSETSSFSDFIVEEEPVKHVIAVVEEKEDQSEAFVNFQQHLTYLEDADESFEEDFDTIDARRELAEITRDFLNELLYEVLFKSEQINAENRLRAKLDKNKLIETLDESVQNYELEKFLNEFINGRVSDYYKRQKNFRVFNVLDPLVEYKEELRYKEALANLDHVKNIVSQAKRMNSYLMASVLMDLQYVSTIVRNTEIHLELTFSRYLIRNNSEYLRRIVERELRLMAHKRNEISDARLFLITRKHSLGRIADKILKLEKISETLFIDDFVAIQNQVVTLDKKIEERNYDLKKLLNKHQIELHEIQHNREKTLVLASRLESKKASLRRKQQRQWQLRELLYEEKMERTRLHKRQNELSFKGGILSMPALMFDYDETMIKLEEKRASVAKLKENLKALMSRVAYYETRNL